MNDPVLRLSILATLLDRSPKTLRRYIDAGLIKAIRPGERGWYGVRASEVRAYLARAADNVALARLEEMLARKKEEA